MDSDPPGSSVRGILQARILDWVAVLSPGDLSKPGISHVSCIGGRVLLPRVRPGMPKTAGCKTTA